MTTAKAPLSLTEYRVLAAAVRGEEILWRQHRQRETWRVNGRAATKTVLALLSRSLLVAGEAGATITPAGITAMDDTEEALLRLAMPATVIAAATVCGRNMGDGLAAVYFADGSFLAVDLPEGTATWRAAAGDECIKGGKPFLKLPRKIRDEAVAAFREEFKNSAAEMVASGKTVKQVRAWIAAQYAQKVKEAA